MALALSAASPTLALEGDAPKQLSSISYFDSLEEQEEAIRAGQGEDVTPSPRVLMYYEYLQNRTAYRRNFEEVLRHSRVSGAAITIPSGTTASYVRSTGGSTTKQTTLSASASARFDVKAVATEVQGSYAYSATASTYAGEQFQVNLLQPGTYTITWYMIGHKYDVSGECRVASTDSGDGRISYLLVEMGFALRANNQLWPYAFMVHYGYATIRDYVAAKHGGAYMLFTPLGKLYLQHRMAQRLAAKALESAKSSAKSR